MSHRPSELLNTMACLRFSAYEALQWKPADGEELLVPDILSQDETTFFPEAIRDRRQSAARHFAGHGTCVQSLAADAYLSRLTKPCWLCLLVELRRLELPTRTLGVFGQDTATGCCRARRASCCTNVFVNLRLTLVPVLLRAQS